MREPLTIRQIAYLVPDIRAAARRHHRDFGSGPYFVADNIPLRLCRHRGQPAVLDHSAAYGQWGSVMVEFIQQNNPGGSALRDLFPAGQGLHHVALFAPDLAAAIRGWEQDGHETALYAEMADGFAFAMIDTVARYGHMVELYQPEPVLLDFYALVAAASRDFHGQDVLRPVKL